MGDPVDLAELMTRCQAGDELAWEALVRRFQARIHAIAYAYTGHPDDARELAQDIFVRLYETRRRWAAPDIFVPWLIRTARNLSVDYLRRKGARTKGGEVELEEAAPDFAIADPETQVVERQRRSLVWRAINRLTAFNREMIVMRDIQELSLQEVAATLRIPIGTVKSRGNRARLELARQVVALSGRAEPPA